jgi:GT2 family glycosyltransferase
MRRADMAGTLLPGRDMTPGFLPAAAFGHTRPTAVGTVDLDPPARAAFTTGVRADHRDALVLVRLHQEPLGVARIAVPADGLSSDRLVALAAQQFELSVRRHQSRFQCRIDEPLCRSAPPEASGTVAVIIPTVGRTDALDRCLRSLTSLPGNYVEIIVVDNRPAAPTRELVASWRSRDRRLRYIAERRPGLSVARNRGIAETQAELVAFTDDDVVVGPTWLAWLLAPFVDANVTAVTGMVLPLELETPAQKQFEQYAGFCKGFDRRTYDLGANRATERLLYPYWGGVFGAGNSMAFRRSWLVASGGFDPALGAGTVAHAGEDIEALSRVVLRGGQLVYEPRSLCWHEHRRDHEGLRAQLFGYGVGLTAMLTKALTHDPGFATAALRSLPLAFATHRRHANRLGTAAALPPHLARIERLGMVRGPTLYARSARSAHRLRLGQVINGG